MYDVAIIGAGITGAMTALFLSEYKLNIVVLEASADIAGGGATKANSAIVHAGYDAIPGTLKAKLNVRGSEMMPEIAKALDVKYKQNGSLLIAYSDAECDTLRSLLARGAQNGVRGLRIVETDELRTMEPEISPHAKKALYAPSAAIVCPYDLAIAACQCATNYGCEFIFNYKVNKIEHNRGGYDIYNRGGDSATAVSARYIVNAAGVMSADIARMTEGDGFPVSIIPRRGQYLLCDKNAGKLISHTLFSVPDVNGKGILMTPTVDGNLMTGPTAETVADYGVGIETTQAGLDAVAAAAVKYVPAWSKRNVITSFSGVRATPSRREGEGDNDFFISRGKVHDTVVHAVGIESPGLASSPATAEMIVSLLGEAGLRLTQRDDFVMRRDSDENPLIRFDRLNDEEKNMLIKNNPAYGKIVCRCEGITEGEIIDAVRRKPAATTIDGVKRRVRAGMGRCQGGFCMPVVTEIIARERGIDSTAVTKKGIGSELLYGDMAARKENSGGNKADE